MSPHRRPTIVWSETKQGSLRPGDSDIIPFGETGRPPPAKA